MSKYFLESFLLRRAILYVCGAAANMRPKGKSLLFRSIVGLGGFGLDRAYANTRTTARSALVKCSVLRYAFPKNQQILGGPKLFSSCIITLNSFSDNGTIGVTAFVELGFVGDGPNDVAALREDKEP